MKSIKVFYQYREEEEALINHEKTIKSYAEAFEIIDSYPWEKELALFEKFGEGGGIFFLLGDEKSQYASYQLIPIEKDVVLLNLEIVLKRGFLGFFGRKSLFKDFDLVPISNAKQHIKELFTYSLDALYDKYNL